jgi:hypothetical protein
MRTTNNKARNKETVDKRKAEISNTGAAVTGTKTRRDVKNKTI